jgi:hypothetical protein
MRTFNTLKHTLVSLGLLLVALVPTSVSWADGGSAGGGDNGACRVQVGSHLVLFTAYQPQFAGTTPYCTEIPELGKAAVVFDYEGKALRNMTVEFEITKEPGKTRFFYQPPEVHPTGTFTRDVEFKEAGDYIAHVTLVNQGQKYDAHVPFSVAGEHGPSLNTYIVIAVVLIALGYILYLSSPAVRVAVDRVLKKTA